MTTHSPEQAFAVDDVTLRVEAMYSLFPYPSQNRREKRLTELANLLRLFSAENAYDFNGMRVLDVGTGTGHRLVTAARLFPGAQFTAVDLAAAPLEIARATAAEAGVSNVEFVQHDIMSDRTDLGRFDVVLCMGVLHHLADPEVGLRHLAKLVEDDGVLFAYVYGAIGSAERMRRKEMLSLLLGADRGHFDAGLRMASALGFDSLNFGWNRNADDAASIDSLIVDSYMNVNETLFDISGVADLIRGSGLDSFMTYGITTDARGYLFDTDLHARSPYAVQWTDMRRFLPGEEAIAAYERLTLRERYRLVELAYQPNGITVLGWRDGAAHRFSSNGRVKRNAISP